MMKLHTARLGLLAAALFFALSFGVSRAEAEETVIVALGDSLTAGYGLPQDQSFPAQLEAALKARGHDVRVVNAGVSGDTALAGLQRLDWAVPDDADAVIVELGANDALQGLPPDRTKATLAKIIARERKERPRDRIVREAGAIAGTPRHRPRRKRIPYRRLSALPRAGCAARRARPALPNRRPIAKPR